MKLAFTSRAFARSDFMALKLERVDRRGKGPGTPNLETVKRSFPIKLGLKGLQFQWKNENEVEAIVPNHPLLKDGLYRTALVLSEG